MNSFMNNLYGAIGSEVSGYHNGSGSAFLGTITYTRAKYGTDISVHVEDGKNIYVIDGSALYEGEGGGYENLHVYFK